MGTQEIGIVGAGSWGTALAILLAQKGLRVDQWVYETDLCQKMTESRENYQYLPGYRLPDLIHLTSDLKRTVSGKSIILIVVPTHVVRKVATDLTPYLSPQCLVINASKGIENDSLCLIHQILKQTIHVPFTPVTLSGPTFAREIASGVPSALVAAGENMETAERVQEFFTTPRLKIFTSTDIIGVEVGGSLKNVIAIAAGISDGLGLGHNARAALITRGLVEITRIGTALGARPETFYGLSGIGDLVLTCTGDLSRNRNVGLQLGQGLTLDKITQGMSMVAEGILTVKSAFNLKNKLNIQASVIDETYRILHEGKPPRQALNDLMQVSISSEFAGVKGLE